MELKPKLVCVNMEPGNRRCLGRCRWHDHSDWLPDPSVCLYPLHTFLRTVRIHPLCGWPVRPGIDSVAWAGPTGPDLLREHDDLSVLGAAVRNSSGADVRTTDHQPYAVQRVLVAGI